MDNILGHITANLIGQATESGEKTDVSTRQLLQTYSQSNSSKLCVASTIFSLYLLFKFTEDVAAGM